jgi:acyl carrier protein
MGLDLAEFLMDVEDLYEIRIDDTKAYWPASTLGDFIGIVMMELERQHPDRARDENLILSDLHEILVERFRVDPAQIRPEARLIQDLGLD